MKESIRIFRFAAIGTLNALIMAVTVWIMMDKLSINYILSNGTAYTLAQIHNFIWCKYWIFPTKKSNTWRQVLLFSMAFGTAYGIQFLFLIGSVEGLNCNKYLAQFLGLFVYGGVNFFINKKITFC
ncbi:GtrA family protein [Bacteroides helcogenes]|uniref:GtrA family protein n=1 Tax=Bacteroides helcogenes (strain ATCC 35417 / DSM 20613 / JCM 6297 / CCUG 15421 / P 36-108) TaxID=693979 RepID=E6STN7_BACT6|nr:GtrA family protein [Bacteroides helcogenes]ADV44284.1 GtrA family protein [Bacteroides helcogenes P 36-108]MDY5238303.1 GtrA family protein [Bacteroides helcogenes]